VRRKGDEESAGTCTDVKGKGKGKGKEKAVGGTDKGGRSRREGGDASEKMEMDVEMALRRREGRDRWKLWEVRAECLEIGGMECYDGYHLGMIEQ
jgi:hypothetical protein